MTAAIRALESERPDRLFTDPFARSLAGEEGFKMLRSPERGMPDVGPYIAIRTRFFDEFAVSVANDGIRQVVLVAAGMDTRALRLEWPASTTVFELDDPELLKVKNRILGRDSPALCRRVAVGTDLEGSWTSALRAAGFRANAPSLWIAEGLFYYLQENAVAEILARLSEDSAPGSALAADFISRSFLTSPWMRTALDSLAKNGTPWLSATDDPEGLLRLLGWSAHVTSPGEPGAGQGRWPYPVLPRTLKDVPHSFMVTAHREEQRQGAC
ncbi:MAG: SAM-dependent methyltransferase [Acidobacteriaceae bacterium]|nr:SAM-dependent methyltransferase [Acidobacteriaceae bacterium]